MAENKKRSKNRYFNRELSWIEFNSRVLGEAEDETLPLLERLKFLCIVTSNFDEFFMVRVAALKRLVRAGTTTRDPSGLTPQKQLELINTRVRELVQRKYACLLEKILPGLASEGIELRHAERWSGSQRSYLREQFETQMLPVLTPVRRRPDQGLPYSGNTRLHIAFLLEPADNSPLGSEEEGPVFAVVQIPPSLNRVVVLPEKGNLFTFTLVEQVIEQNAGLLFPGSRIIESAVFRVTRDADFGVDEERDEDFVEAMEQVLEHRERSFPVRLTVSRRASSGSLAGLLRSELDLADHELFFKEDPLDLGNLMSLVSLPGFDHLRYPRWQPAPSQHLDEDSSIWDVLKKRDLLLHHPYVSFDPVVRLVQSAADDPDVLAIKMTLYRTSGDSAIVAALQRAAENGKQVTVLVEIKARFDEQRNIDWAQQLEQTGAIIVYGIARLKVHAKTMIIVRRELAGIQRYIHFGTGNYNESTSRLYTDIGLLTARDDLAYDAGLFFNAITGYSGIPVLKKLSMAPTGLKSRLLTLIEREAARSSRESPGHIIAKLNSLADIEVIEALYAASNAGVRVELNVRGICMLVPGVKKQSENITVVSIVDRFLEHSRLFYFQNGSSPEFYMSSADWMPRNLERRIELMIPIEQPELSREARDILAVCFRDNTNAHVLQSDGSYLRATSKSPGKRFNAQAEFQEMASRQRGSNSFADKKEFAVRRLPAQKRSATRSSR